MPLTPSVAAQIRSSQEVLERNLRALARSSPETCALIRAAVPRDDLVWSTGDDGRPTAALRDGGQLASRRRPADEGAALARSVDLAQAGAIMVMGFGLGYHVASLAERLKRCGVILVHEPDLALLRAVLERVDHSAALEASNVAILHDAEDVARLSTCLAGIEGVVAIGAKILHHPPSAQRLGPNAERLGRAFAEVLKSVRTNVVTSLLQVDTTLRNIFQNIDRYVTVPGIAALRDIAKGKPAIVVSAGPSLSRNIRELSRPGVRDHVVIIAVQTVLKTLLRHGIRPHFVAALDYNEISKRFYEGLTENDVRGITLIAEPKANPAILDAFPGAIRCVSDTVLETLLGPGMTRDMGSLPQGATVAHLCAYFARHLGCDPLILVGQDLGFTDGQYYGAHAAIHETWACELNEFRTLEMLEWERIVRFGALLRTRTDVFGRPIYTDEQMSTYLLQFEREFQAEEKHGLKVIDATEGGVAKAHTTPMTLRAALDAYASGPPIVITPTPTPGLAAPRRIRVARARLAEVRHDTLHLADLCERSAHVLEQMRRTDDQREINSLISKVYRLRSTAQQLTTAQFLTQYLNQTGVLNRFRADRALAMNDSLSDAARQKHEIERDLVNVRWLREAALQMSRMLSDAIATLDGGQRITRDPPLGDERLLIDHAGGVGSSGSDAADSPRTRVGVVITFDPERDGLGRAHDPARAVVGSYNTLQCTLLRVDAAQNIDDIAIVSPDPDAARAIAGPLAKLPSGRKVSFVRADGATWRDRREAAATARLWARECWRGGIAQQTCFDEALVPDAVATAMSECTLTAAVVIGAEWSLVAPDLIDAVIARHRDRPSAHSLVFTPAPPGLGCVLVSREILDDLAKNVRAAGVFASIGGLVGYVPVRPRLDPLGRPVCVSIPTSVRDAGMRFTLDGPNGAALARHVHMRLGDRLWAASAEEITRAAIDARASMHEPPSVAHLSIVGAAGEFAAERDIYEQLDKLAATGARTGVTIQGDLIRTNAGLLRAEPTEHPAWREIVRRAAGLNLGVHVRTSLPSGTGEAMLASGAHAISVDLLCENAETYQQLTGLSDFDKRIDELRAMLAARRVGAGGLPSVWIIPRLTRRDAVYEHIEPFFAGWLMHAGAAVIDALPEEINGERIVPLPLPTSALERFARTRKTITFDASNHAENDGAAKPTQNSSCEQERSSLMSLTPSNSSSALSVSGLSADVIACVMPRLGIETLTRAASGAA
jgi:hypothetical protein